MEDHYQFKQQIRIICEFAKDVAKEHLQEELIDEHVEAFY